MRLHALIVHSCRDRRPRLSVFPITMRLHASQADAQCAPLQTRERSRFVRRYTLFALLLASLVEGGGAELARRRRELLPVSTPHNAATHLPRGQSGRPVPTGLSVAARCPYAPCLPQSKTREGASPSRVSYHVPVCFCRRAARARSNQRPPLGVLIRSHTVKTIR